MYNINYIDYKYMCIVLMLYIIYINLLNYILLFSIFLNIYLLVFPQFLTYIIILKRKNIYLYTYIFSNKWNIFESTNSK